MNILFVAIGGAVGAVCRYLISNYFKRSADRFPVGTFIINMSGTFLLGLLLGGKVGPIWTLLFGTGFCGAFTTFSTLQWELFQLKQTKQTSMFLYLILTYSSGIIMALLGYFTGKLFYDEVTVSFVIAYITP